MVLCDSNVWLALALSKHVHHKAAREWLEAVEKLVSVCFCRATQRTFLRLSGLESRWKQFALRDTASPKIWMDAYLAGFARAGGYRLVTTDTAFKQFTGLDLELLGKEETG